MKSTKRWFGFPGGSHGGCRKPDRSTSGVRRPPRGKAGWVLFLFLGAGFTITQESAPILDRYDLSGNGGSSQDLPRVLQEISGLASTSDGRLFAHDDERANVFQVDPETGEILKAFSVGLGGTRGDFEGIAIAGERFFLITSVGQLFEFREGEAGATVGFRVYPLNLGLVCEMEGLAFDPGTETLLLPCKNPRSSRLRNHLVVLSVALESMKLDPNPRIAIPLQELDSRGLDDEFHPSSIEVHPGSGSLVLVAAREEAMVELSPQGEILATEELKRKDHPQPEGLAFLPDGSLILADEGQGERGTITRYLPKVDEGGDIR
ncbi:MAG: SdiA-regulated domain-containing protein [Gemmatimonadota bacterium]|jgi:uncharacterized protein YjiK